MRPTSGLLEEGNTSSNNNNHGSVVMSGSISAGNVPNVPASPTSTNILSSPSNQQLHQQPQPQTRSRRGSVTSNPRDTSRKIGSFRSTNNIITMGGNNSGVNNGSSSNNNINNNNNNMSAPGSRRGSLSPSLAHLSFHNNNSNYRASGGAGADNNSLGNGQHYRTGTPPGGKVKSIRLGTNDSAVFKRNLGGQPSDETSPEVVLLKFGFVFFSLIVALPMLVITGMNWTDFEATNYSKGTSIVVAFAALLMVTWIPPAVVMIMGGSVRAFLVPANQGTSSSSTNCGKLLSLLIVISQICIFVLGLFCVSFRPTMITIEVVLLFAAIHGNPTLLTHAVSPLAVVFCVLLSIADLLGLENAGAIPMFVTGERGIRGYFAAVSGIVMILAGVLIAVTQGIIASTTQSWAALQVTKYLGRYDTSSARRVLDQQFFSQMAAVAGSTTPSPTKMSNSQGQAPGLTAQQLHHQQSLLRQQQKNETEENTNNKDNNNNNNNKNNKRVQDPTMQQNILLLELEKVVTLLENARAYIPEFVITGDLAEGASARGGEGRRDDGEGTESSIVISESHPSQGSKDLKIDGIGMTDSFDVNKPGAQFTSSGNFNGTFQLANEDANNVGVGAAGGALRGQGEVAGKISVVVLNYHLDPAAPLPEYSEQKFVERVNQQAKVLHGVAHHFIGGHAIVSWNALRHTAAPESKAARFMHQMSQFSGDAHISCSGVAMTGRARCHIVGERSKHVILYSTWWPTLLHLAAVAKAKNAMLIDSPTKTAVFYEYNLRGFGIFDFCKSVTTRHKVNKAHSSFVHNSAANSGGQPQQQQQHNNSNGMRNSNTSLNTKNNNNNGVENNNNNNNPNAPQHPFDRSSEGKSSPQQQQFVDDYEADRQNTLNNTIPPFARADSVDDLRIDLDQQNNQQHHHQPLNGENGAIGGSFFSKGVSIVVFELLGERHQDNVEWLFIYQAATSSDNTVKDVHALSCVALELASQQKFNDAARILRRVHQLSRNGELKDIDDFVRGTFEQCQVMLYRLTSNVNPTTLAGAGGDNNNNDGANNNNVESYIDGNNFSVKVSYSM